MTTHSDASLQQSTPILIIRSCGCNMRVSLALRKTTPVQGLSLPYFSTTTPKTRNSSLPRPCWTLNSNFMTRHWRSFTSSSHWARTLMKLITMSGELKSYSIDTPRQSRHLPRWGLPANSAMPKYAPPSCWPIPHLPTISGHFSARSVRPTPTMLRNCSYLKPMHSVTGRASRSRPLIAV